MYIKKCTELNHKNTGIKMEEYELTPTERAEEFIHNILFCSVMPLNEAKQIAMFKVVDVVNELKKWGAPYLFEDAKDNDWANERLKYWDKVTQEINNYNS